MEWIGELLQNDATRTLGILALVGLGVIYLVREWRATRKLTTEERQARREGFAAQVDLLMRELAECRAECRGQLSDQQSLRRENDDFRRLAYQIQEQQRREILDLREEVEGLKRKQAHESGEIAKLKGGRT